MINFTLDKIQLRNVRCYGDEMMEMDFPINNLTVFTGPVGAGKSTILKSVSMALYGEDGGAKGEKLAIDDMVNEKNKKNLEIHLYFHSTVDDGKDETKYEIHLFHKHSKYNNKLVFVKNGRDISLESKTATYELIEKTLMPKNVYHNIYYFTQQAKNFFTALPNNEQKEIFNSILDLSEYKDYYSNTKDCITQSELKITSCTSSIESTKETLNSLKKLYGDTVTNIINEKDICKNKILNLQHEIEESVKNKFDLENHRTELQQSANDLDKTILEHSRLTTHYEHEIDKLKTKYENTRQHYNDVILEGLKQKFIKIKDDKSKEIDDNLTQIKFEIKEIKSQIDNITNQFEIEKHNINNNIRNKYANIVDELTQKKSKIDEDILKSKHQCIEDLNNLKNNIQEEVIKIKDKLSNLNNNLSACLVKIDNYNFHIDEIESNIDKYKNKLNEPDAVCEMCGQKLIDKNHIYKHIEQLEKKQTEVLTSKNDILKNKSVLESEIEECNNLIQQYKDKFDKEKEIRTQNYNDLKDKLTSESDVIVRKRSDIENKINEEIQNGIKDKFNKVENEINVKQESINRLNEDCVKLQNKKDQIVNDLRAEYKIELSKLQSEYQSQINEIDTLIKDNTSKLNNENDITTEAFKKREKQQTQLNILSKDINDLIISIDSKTNLIKQYNEQISKNVADDKSIVEISENISQYEDTLNDKQKVLDILNYENSVLDFWKQAFSDSGIKSMLIDSAIPHMNECVAKELEKVAPGVFTVSFDTLSETKTGKMKDKFTINIVNNVKGSTGHKKLSGGEKRIIDLCCMSALRSLAEKLYNKRFTHIFYDEILDSLDVEFKQMFCANVKLQSQTGCHVSLITHDLPEDVDPDRVFPF